MNIKTNATDRKAMVKAISEHIGSEINYEGPPSFAYKVGDYTINRDSSIEAADELIEELRPFLEEQGYIEAEVDTLNVRIPTEEMDGLALRNLVFMLNSKQYILNRVLRREVFKIDPTLIEDLEAAATDRASDFHATLESQPEAMTGLAFEDGNAVFTFPVCEEAEKNRAMTELCALMVSAAREAKRVNPTVHQPENEKYYLRIWLLRLGLSGEGGKASRKALLGGLTGHTAFRTPEAAEKFKVDQKAKRAAQKAAAQAEREELTPDESDDTAHSLAEALADAALIHAVNNSFEVDPE